MIRIRSIESRRLVNAPKAKRAQDSQNTQNTQFCKLPEFKISPNMLFFKNTQMTHNETITSPKKSLYNLKKGLS